MTANSRPLIAVLFLCLALVCVGSRAQQILVAVVAPNETPPAGTAYAANTIADAVNFLVQNTVKTQERKLYISHGTYIIDGLELENNFDSLIIEGTREKNTTLECSSTASFAINLNGARNVSISYLTIRKCWPTAGLAVTSSQDITLSNLDISANGVIGGAIVSSAARNLKILNCTFADNQAYRGGGLYVINSDRITIDNSRFSNNTAFLSGGAAFFRDTKSILFRRCTFDTNRARASSSIAGAIHLQNSMADIIDCTLRNNSAAAHGGALAATDHSSASIHNSTFIDNRAVSRGGALFANDSSVLDPIFRTDFYNNSASLGGALALSATQSTIYQSKIQYNTARELGGGTWTDLQTKLELIASNVSLNSATVGFQMGCRNSCVWLDVNSTICSPEGSDRQFPSYASLNSVRSQFGLESPDTAFAGLTCDSCHFFDQSESPCIPSTRSSCLTSPLGSCSWRTVTPWIMSQPRPQARLEHIMLRWKSGFVIHGGGFSNDSNPTLSMSYVEAIPTRLAYSDVWYYDLNDRTWMRLDRDDPTAPRPIPRWRHAAVMLDDSSFLIHGGSCATTVLGCNSAGLLSDMWRFDLLDGTWSRWNYTIDGPPNAVSRHGHSMWILNNDIVIYGGSVVDRGIWALNPSTMRWSALHLPSASPSPLNRACYGSDVAVNDTFALFSGISVQSNLACFTQDVWVWNHTASSWSVLSQASFPWDRINYRWSDDSYGPDARAGHQFIRISNTSFFLFGGRDAAGFKGNVWEFSITSRCFVRRANRFDTLFGPGSRYGFGSLFLNDLIYLFGGASETIGGSDDIWLFDPRISGFGTPIRCGSTSPASFYVIGVIFTGAWMFLLGVWLFFRGQTDTVDEEEPKSRSERLQPRWLQPNLYFIPKNGRSFAEAFDAARRRPGRSSSSGSSSSSVLASDNDDSRDEESDESGDEIVESSEYRPFDDLSDEMIIRVMSFLSGADLASLVACSRRMNALGNDNSVWRSVVADYWEETPEFANLRRSAAEKFSYKSFFIHGAAAFRRSKREGKMRAAVNVAHSTVPFYFVVFILAIQIFLAGLKFDRVAPLASAPWAATLIPSLLLGCVAVAVCCVALYVRLRYRIGTAALSGLSPSMRVTVRFVSRPGRLGFGFLISIASLMSPVLISIRADGAAPISWWLALAPLMIFLACCCVIPGRLICSHRISFIWLAVGGPLFLLITLILVAAKLEGAIDADWCILFVPWWVSEVFLLSAAVGLCLYANKAIVGWILSICSVAYITCMIVVRTLLCANLGPQDGCSSVGQPVAFPVGVVFVPLYLVLLLTFNGLIFMTNHLPNTEDADDVSEAPLDNVDDLGFAEK